MSVAHENVPATGSDLMSVPCAITCEAFRKESAVPEATSARAISASTTTSFKPISDKNSGSYKPSLFDLFTVSSTYFYRTFSRVKFTIKYSFVSLKTSNKNLQYEPLFQ